MGMKKPPKGAKAESFDMESFIEDAASKQHGVDDTSPGKRSAKRRKKAPSNKSVLPAAGLTRTSFDLPDDMRARLKDAAWKERRPMRELVTELLDEGLKKRGS